MPSLLQRKSGITLRHQIKDALINDLASLSYGAKILSEDILSEKFGVSRGTIRQAILELMHQGLLFRIQGKGTFKSGIAVYNSGFNITSLTEQLKRGGFTPGIKNISVSSLIPDENIRSLLMLETKEPVWKISRIRLANNVPISRCVAYLRMDIAPNLEVSDLEMSLIEMITKKFGLHIIKSENNCKAILSDKPLSKLLEIDVGSPILHVEHIAFGFDGRPVFVDISESIGDRYIQRFEQMGIS